MRVLFLTHRLPYAPNRGDRIRAYHLLRHLRQSFEVDLLSLIHDADEASHTQDVAGFASSVAVVRVTRVRNIVRSAFALPTSTPLTHTLLDAPSLVPTLERLVRARPPSVVLAYCSGMARLALAPPLAAVPLVLDMVDVDSAKWAALAAVTTPPRSWIYAREGRALAKFERAAGQHAFATLVTTDREKATLDALAPGTRVEIVGNGVDIEHWRPAGPPSDEPRVVFCGVMNYGPNTQGAEWLVHEVWPLVRRAHPAAQLQLVGAQPTPAIRRLADSKSGVVVTGFVPDVRPYLWGAAVSVAPLFTARGVQNKVLEAVAAGIPAVVTPVVLEGLPVAMRPACVEARDAARFAAAITTLLGEASNARRARAGRANLAELSWDRCLAPVAPLLESATTASRRG